MGRAGRNPYSKAAAAMALVMGKAAWKRYNPWKKASNKGKGKYRRVGYYGRFNGGPGRELKFFNLANVNATGTVSSTGEIFPTVNNIGQGTNESQRIGRKCTIRSLQWHYTITLPVAASAIGDDVIRVILYLDKQANGAAALVTDVLYVADYNAFYNPENMGRFRILMDRSHAINATAGDANRFSKTYQGHFSKRCTVPLEFSQSTGALTEIKSNNIGVLFISMQGQATFDSVMRLRFNG